MTSNEILKADVLDILFDNRNKQYGAYTLRKSYNKRLGLSLGISLSLVLLLFLFARMNGGDAITLEQGQVVDLRPIILPPDKVQLEIPKPPKSNTAKPAATQEFIQPKIIEDILVDHPMADQDDLAGAQVSDHTSDGTEATPGQLPPQEGSGVAKEPEVKNDPPAEMTVQSEPEFPGGMKAWQKFLNKYLNVPGELEAGEKKSVIISFKVAEDGFVTGFQIMQSAGALYDNEVLRVLKKMPKWKPAIQNNKPVARSFTQPVTFMGVAE